MSYMSAVVVKGLMYCVQERPTYCGSKVNDSVYWEGGSPDYKQDAEQVLAKLEQESKDEKSKWVPEVSSQLDLEKGAA